MVARVLSALTSLCELGLFQKMRIWELLSATLSFFYHPNVWIRQGGSRVIIYLRVAHLNYRCRCFCCIGSEAPSAQRHLVHLVPIATSLAQVGYQGDG